MRRSRDRNRNKRCGEAVLLGCCYVHQGDFKGTKRSRDARARMIKGFKDDDGIKSAVLAFTDYKRWH